MGRVDDVYLFLANRLIGIVRDPGRDDDYIFYESERTGEYGFRYKRGYGGLMAKPPRTGASAGKVKKKRQGLFDIEILTGNRHGGKVTHRHLFEALIQGGLLDMLRQARMDDVRHLLASVLGKRVDPEDLLAGIAPRRRGEGG